MSARKTRSQASKARDTPASSSASSSDEERHAQVNGHTNGNGNAHKTSDASDDVVSENIFLFWPNIIGTP